jgi:hypothetical protein
MCSLQARTHITSASPTLPCRGFRGRQVRNHVLCCKLALLGVGLEVDERGEEQDHIPPLVHDGRVAEGAAHFARQLVRDGLGAGVVPLEVVVAVREVDVLLVEDGRPLERRAVLRLTGRAVAVLAVEGLLPVQLVAHPSAVAVCFVQGLELLVVAVDAVGRLALPFGVVYFPST